MLCVPPAGFMTRDVSLCAVLECHYLRRCSRRALLVAYGNRVNAFRDDPSALLCLLTRLDETDRWKGAEASITRLAREREAKDPLLGSARRNTQIQVAT